MSLTIFQPPYTPVPVQHQQDDDVTVPDDTSSSVYREQCTVCSAQVK